MVVRVVTVPSCRFSRPLQRMRRSPVAGLLHLSRDVALAVQHTPDVDVVGVLDVIDEGGIPRQRPGAQARQVQRVRRIAASPSTGAPMTRERREGGQIRLSTFIPWKIKKRGARTVVLRSDGVTEAPGTVASTRPALVGGADAGLLLAAPAR